MLVVLKILAILALLYFLIRKKWELGYALAACAVATGLLFMVPWLTFLTTVWTASVKPDTLSVLALVVFILVLSCSMRDAGALNDLVESVRSMFVDNRFTIGALPALIGLLPMPGGALFSAPMIEGLSDEAGLSPEDRTYLNYWFRHVWEYSYPLYPGLIITSAILGVEIQKLVTFQFPLSLAAILAGSLFGLLQIPKHFRQPLKGPEIRHQLMTFGRGFWPILLIIIGLTVINIPAIKALIKIQEPFLLVLTVVVPLFGLLRFGPKKFIVLAWKSLDYKLLGTIYAVLVFKDIITVSGAVYQLSTVFKDWGIPPLVLFIVIPLLIGYLTGITHSYVSVAFPLLLPFFGDPVDLAKVQFAYMFGFIGIMYSPVHLCLVLSTKYFNADMNQVYRKMFLPTLVLIAVTFLLYFTLQEIPR